MKFSVITPSLNQGEFIRRNIESVLAQDYLEFEHIIIDGGSTDSTISVLNKYPHLKWVSEPDRGQSNALNKAVFQATGDVIAWLNSDDWYAPGTFAKVADAIRDYPLVMGACGRADRSGSIYEIVENVERTRCDLLKYWVFNAVPDQPGVFFTRELLDSVSRLDGLWFNEDLSFTMDLDLWLRISEKYPFSKRVPETLAFCRIYEEAKTGRDMAGAYREMSSLFRIYGDKTARATKPLSFIPETVAAAPDFFQAMDAAVRNSDGSIVCCLAPGLEVSADFAARAEKLFENDATGIAFTSLGGPELESHLFRREGERLRLSPEGLFTAPIIPEVFLCRKIAFLDAGGFRQRGPEFPHMRDLLIRLIHRGWQVRVDPGLAVIQKGWKPGAGFPETSPDYQRFLAEIIIGLEEEDSRDPFSQVRKEHGFCLQFPDELIEDCRRRLR